MQNSTDLRKLTAEAKKLLVQFTAAEETLVADFDYTAERAWQLGRKLNPIKKLVGHGNWEKWRTDAFLALDDRAARRCMALDRMNPSAQKFADLSSESLRKYRFGYVPVKERTKLKGDKKFERPSHHSSVVNECNKLMRRIDAGLYQPDMRELLSDFDPFFRWLSKGRGAERNLLPSPSREEFPKLSPFLHV